MALSFFLGHFLEFVGRITEHAEKHAAAHVFPFGIPLIRQGNHLIHEMECFLDVAITGFQGLANSP
jgi:hypothetical protein